MGSGDSQSAPTPEATSSSSPVPEGSPIGQGAADPARADSTPRVLHFLLGAAAVVVLVAGLQHAQGILAPFLFAAFLAILCTPPLHWLQERGLPAWLALLLVVVIVTGVLVFLVTVATSSIDHFVRNMQRPGGYLDRLAEYKQQLFAWLEEHHVNLPDNFAQQAVQPQRWLQLLAGMLASLGSVLSNTLLVLVILVFMLLEASTFPDKLLQIAHGQEKSLQALQKVSQDIRGYISTKTLLSLATGLLVWLWLWVLDVDYPLLWGILAFLFNFVPNIGSVLAAVPALALALIDPGPQVALYAAIGYVVINGVIGYAVEPKLLGDKLELSPLVVFLSLVFWGWVLGPVGMLLSVPLTTILKTYLYEFPETRWAAILLGGGGTQPRSAASRES